VPSYPAGLSVSNHALTTLATVLRRPQAAGYPMATAVRGQAGPAGDRASAQGRDLHRPRRRVRDRHHDAFRYVRETIDVLAAQALTLEQAVAVAAGKAFVILDGTLLRIDRVGMGSGRDRRFYSGKHKVSRRERAGHLRPGRSADLGLTRGARRTPRHGCCP
jgi:hypothetical protein